MWADPGSICAAGCAALMRGVPAALLFGIDGGFYYVRPALTF
jgi:hypothetical protein